MSTRLLMAGCIGAAGVRILAFAEGLSKSLRALIQEAKLSDARRPVFPRREVRKGDADQAYPLRQRENRPDQAKAPVVKPSPTLDRFGERLASRRDHVGND